MIDSLNYQLQILPTRSILITTSFVLFLISFACFIKSKKNEQYWKSGFILMIITTIIMSSIPFTAPKTNENNGSIFKLYDQKDIVITKHTMEYPVDNITVDDEGNLYANFSIATDFYAVYNSYKFTLNGQNNIPILIGESNAIAITNDSPAYLQLTQETINEFQ